MIKTISSPHPGSFKSCAEHIASLNRYQSASILMAMILDPIIVNTPAGNVEAQMACAPRRYQSQTVMSKTDDSCSGVHGYVARAGHCFFVRNLPYPQENNYLDIDLDEWATHGGWPERTRLLQSPRSLLYRPLFGLKHLVLHKRLSVPTPIFSRRPGRR